MLIQTKRLYVSYTDDLTLGLLVFGFCRYRGYHRNCALYCVETL